jgi:cytochrome P450
MSWDRDTAQKAAKHGQIPPGPQDDCRTTDNLLSWMDQQFRKFGDIYKASLFGTNVYAIRDPEFAHHVLVRNWQNYVRGQFIKRIAFLLGNGLIVSEGELWKRQRRMIQPAFRSKPIGDLTNLIATVNSALLKKWQLSAERRESCNVTHDVSGMVLEVVLRSILGDDYEQIGFHFDILTEEPARDLAFAQSFRALGKLILQVVDRRRKGPSPPTDILGMLMQARDPQSGQLMQDRQLINEILTLIVAGHETTACTLNWTWYLISQHPEVEEKLSNELDNLTNVPELEDLPKFPYSRQIIEEAMRLYPALWLMTRKAVQDDQLGNYFVPAGTEIYVSPYFIQRHPDLWEDPDRFNPDRFGPDHSKCPHRLAMMPFAAGPRNCIGESLARLEMQIHLLIIAKRLRLRYVPSRPLELEAGVNLRNKYDFIMYPELKCPASAAGQSID